MPDVGHLKRPLPEPPPELPPEWRSGGTPGRSEHARDAVLELPVGGLLAADEGTSLSLVGGDLVCLGQLLALDLLGALLELVELGLGRREHALLGLQVDGRILLGLAQQVSAISGRGGDGAERVERRLVLRDGRCQLGVLVAVGEVRGGIAHDVREGAGVDDLLQEAGALASICVRESGPKGRASGVQLIRALLDLLLQHVQGHVQLLQLLLERGATCLDLGQRLGRLLDLLLDLRLVRIDAVELAGGLGESGPGGRRIALQTAEHAVLLVDVTPQARLTRLGGGDLVRERGGGGGRRGHRKPKQGQ